MIAMSASISTLSVAILFIVPGSVISARVPTSLPVPAVVGIWASDHAARRRAVRAGDVGQPLSLVTSTATSLARSMALPPPKPTTASASAAFAAATAASRFGRSGSGFTSPKSAASVRPRTSSRAALTLSATTKGRRAPVAASQGASVSTWPAPKRRMAGRCISIGDCRVSMGSLLRRLRAFVPSGPPGPGRGRRRAGGGCRVGGGFRRWRGRCRSRRRGPFP